MLLRNNQYQSGRDTMSQTKRNKSVKEKSQVARLKQLERKAAQRETEYDKSQKHLAPPKSVQESLRYKAMFKNGICDVDGFLYSKTIKISDINYQTARRDDQINMFSDYCSILNSFDPSVKVQINIVNQHLDEDDFKEKMLLTEVDDTLNDYRKEFNNMLIDKTLQGQNNIIHEKYITISGIFSSYEQATSRLTRIVSEAASLFKKLGCEINECSGTDRLRLIHNQLLPHERFNFEYKKLLYSGLKTKDFVCPSSLDSSPKNFYEYGDGEIGQTLFLKDLPSDLSDKFISDLIEIPVDLTISLHVQTVEKSKAFDLVGKKITFMGQQKTHEIKNIMKNTNGIYDDSMLPYELRYSLEDAEELRDNMQNKNQQMFKFTMLINTHARTIEELTDTIFQITTVARKYNCKFSSLDYMQEEGLNSILPLGKNFVPINRRTLTTASTAIFMPFTNMELYQSGGIYYGLNALSKNLLFFDRRSLKAANGLIFGTPGSGKSFAAKREMISVLLNDPTAEVLILDPEREYSSLAIGFDGEVVNISASSKSHINALDINLDYADDSDPISLKSEFILSLIELLVGGSTGLSAKERSVIDRTAILIYQKYFQYSNPDKMPTLKDFWKILKEQPEEEAQSLALSLESYVTGSLSTFAHKTNVDIKKRLVVFDMKDLGKQLKPMGMLIVLDQIWNRITENRNKGRRTWIYIDEMQLYFNSEQCSSYFMELWSRARKWGAIPTGITQNVETLLTSTDGRRILSNSTSSFIMMLNQSKLDGEELANLLNISDELMDYVTNSDSGHGLLFSGKSIIPFEDKFPTDTRLYQMMTTKVEELNQME